jgi:hypothetical protein
MNNHKYEFQNTKFEENPLMHEHYDQLREERNLTEMLPSGLLEELIDNKGEDFFSENEENTNDASLDKKVSKSESFGMFYSDQETYDMLKAPSRNKSHQELMVKNIRQHQEYKDLIDYPQDMMKECNRYNRNFLLI